MSRRALSSFLSSMSERAARTTPPEPKPAFQTAEERAAAEARSSRPAAPWWTTPADGWAEARGAAFSAWRDGSASTLDSAAAVVAIGFGFGAHAVYADGGTWDEVLPRLQADWDERRDGGGLPWDDVQGAVRAGWRSAAARRSR